MVRPASWRAVAGTGATTHLRRRRRGVQGRGEQRARGDGDADVLAAAGAGGRARRRGTAVVRGGRAATHVVKRPRAPRVRGDGGSGRPPSCNAASSPPRGARLHRRVQLRAAPRAGRRSRRTEFHSAPTSAATTGRTRAASAAAVALRASALNLGPSSSEPASSSARCQTGKPKRPGDDWVVWAALRLFSWQPRRR